MEKAKPKEKTDTMQTGRPTILARCLVSSPLPYNVSSPYITVQADNYKSPSNLSKILTDFSSCVFSETFIVRRAEREEHPSSMLHRLLAILSCGINRFLHVRRLSPEVVEQKSDHRSHNEPRQIVSRTNVGFRNPWIPYIQPRELMG